MSAWPNWIYRLLDRYIFPLIPGFDAFMLSYVVSKAISKSLVLDFVKGEESFRGKVPWINAIKSPIMNMTP